MLSLAKSKLKCKFSNGKLLAVFPDLLQFQLQD